MHTFLSTHAARLVRVLGVATFVALLASPLFAQARVQTPDKGVIGYGADVGVLFPDDAFENTLAIDGFGEYYLTPRISVRGMLSFGSPGVALRTEDHFRQVKLLFSGVYNWEHRAWRPFVLAGAGAYFVRLHLDASTDPPGETRGGLNFGGGTEYVLSSNDSLKAELRWDVVSHPVPLPNATGATFTIGYKRYF